MRATSHNHHIRLDLRMGRLIDRTPVDLERTVRELRLRKARIAVLAAILVTVALAISSLALPLLTDSSDAPRKALATYNTRGNIMIFGDDFTPANGVTGGSGSASDPWVINGWQIDASVDGYGIIIYGTSEYYQISNVRIYGTGGDCIMLSEAPNGRVNDSLFENSNSAVLAITCTNMSFENNTITSQTFGGIMLLDCSMVLIANNTIDQAETAGIMLAESSYALVKDNVVTNVNGFGMAVTVTDNIMIERNNASSNAFVGLYVNDTRNVQIEENNFTLNEMYGLYVGNISSGIVFHNRFVGNFEQALRGPNVTSFAWDDGYPSGGNYWSDYTGEDNDLDGIGDTPYSVAGGGTDRYPFVDESFEPIPEFGMFLVPILGMAAIVVFTRRRTREA
jgi:parallel beta-helix repeat protein